MKKGPAGPIIRVQHIFLNLKGPVLEYPRNIGASVFSSTIFGAPYQFRYSAIFHGISIFHGNLELKG